LANYIYIFIHQWMIARKERKRNARNTISRVQMTTHSFS